MNQLSRCRTALVSLAAGETHSGVVEGGGGGRGGGGGKATASSGEREEAGEEYELL